MINLNRRQILAGAGATVAINGVTWPVLAQARNTVTVSNNRDIQGTGGFISPHMRVGYQENNILRSVCEGLIAFKPTTYEWEPLAARTIRQVSDTLIEFELHPGRMFHGDFGEMTAEDVKFSFEIYAQPGPNGRPSAYAGDWSALDRVEVTGRHSGRIHLKNPAPQLWLVTLPEGSGLIFSKRAWEAGHYRIDATPLRIIGTGAYMFHEWVANQRVVLRKNPAYTGTPATYDEIVIRPIREPRTAELAVRADELQLATIEPSSADEVRRLPNTTVQVLDSINYVWIGMNVEKAPFNDIRVRQAISAAIDVDQLVQGAYNGSVGRAYSVIAPGLLGHWAQAPRPRRDVALARRLLQEAGHGSGFQTRLTLLNRAVFQNVGQIAQAMLAEVGIRLTLDVQDAGTFWSMGNGDNGRNIDMALQRFGGKADPAFQTQWFVSSQIGTWNWQRWNSPQFDDVNRRAGSTANADERGRLYVEAQRLMAESAAYIWLTHERNVFAYRNWLRPAILPNGDDWQFSKFARA